MKNLKVASNSVRCVLTLVFRLQMNPVSIKSSETILILNLFKFYCISLSDQGFSLEDMR